MPPGTHMPTGSVQSFVPLIGGIVLLIFLALEGTRGSNRFGEDPKPMEDPRSAIIS